MTAKKRSHWKGKSTPTKFFGFCYEIVNTVTGQRYIGRKQYYSSSGRCKSRVTNRQSAKWNPKHWKESNWKSYQSSCTKLKADIKELGKSKFTFRILSEHVSRAELNYAEVHYQVHLDVLREDYYNGNISAIRFIPPPFSNAELVRKNIDASKPL